MGKLKRLSAILLLVSVIMLSASTQGFSKPEYDNAEEEVRGTIESFFDAEYRSFQDYQMADFSNLVKDNDNTAFYLGLLKSNLEFARIFDLGYKNYDISLDFTHIEADESSAKVIVTMDADYQYKNAGNIESGIYNVDYSFTLQLKNDIWVIAQIDRFSIEDGFFKAEVDKKIKKGKNKSRREAIYEATEDRINRGKEMYEELKDDEKVEIGDDPSNKLFRAAVVSINYNGETGKEYAKRFAKANPSWFYTYPADCTNLVSQCVWAAYGGYVLNNDVASKNNMNNQKRMVPGTWYGGTTGASKSFRGVVDFWNYVTGPKTTGPVGTGSNNNQSAKFLNPSQIKVGDVLQLRSGSTGAYSHSVYVTIRDPNMGVGYASIYVSQHSSNEYNRNALIMISQWGGLIDCYMRRITFSSANFAS